MKKEYTIVGIIILIGILLPAIFISMSGLTLINDGADWLITALSKFSLGEMWMGCPFPHRARKFILIMQAIPINVAYFIFKISSFKTYVQIFASTLILLPIVLCLYSGFIFHRAKKTYLSVFPILTLVLYIYPVIVYGVVESYIAGYLFFILFQYLFLKIELKIYDKIFILFLSIAVYYSHESIVLFAPLFWLTYYLYTDKNSKLMKFCIINTFFAVIEMFIFAYTSFGPNILEYNASTAPFQFLHIPMFWNNGTSTVLNFQACYFAIFSTAIILCLFIKNIKFHILLNTVILLFFIAMKSNFYLYLFSLYRFMCLYSIIAFILLIIFLSKKDNILKKAAKCAVPLIFTAIIISNVYLINLSKEFSLFKDKLVEASSMGYFYYEENLDLFMASDFHKYMISQNIEQLSYSTIAVNSVRNRNVTKGLILGGGGYNRLPINICPQNEIIHVDGGALYMNLVTPFWDLSPYKDKFIQKC